LHGHGHGHDHDHDIIEEEGGIRTYFVLWMPAV